ncbi:MAG: hypothetical protein PHR36_02855, partial [Patescibacteria group bacterium]|nr:hypothetical protein [Patescibacteria group bacterium]
KEEEDQYFANKFSELDKEIAVIEKEAEKVLVFEKKLKLVNSLISQHVYWTNFFKFLEDNTLTDVYYSGFSGDNKGEYGLTASGKNFNIIQAQVERLLASKYVLGASVEEARTSAAGGQEANAAGGVAFGLRLVINPAIFTAEE